MSALAIINLSYFDGGGAHKPSFIIKCGQGEAGLPNSEVEYIAIGRILKPQGNRGEVKILPLTDFPERFATMDKIRLDLDGRLETRSIEKVSSHGRFIVMKLSGIDDMNAALLLRNAILKVTRQELVPLPDGEYYVFDLVGLNVHTTTGRHLGQVKDVLQTGANDVYIVEGGRHGDYENRENLAGKIQGGNVFAEGHHVNIYRV